jgi:hypothetical protein
MIVRIFPKYSSARRGERESTFSEKRNAGLADAAPALAKTEMPA